MIRQSIWSDKYMIRWNIWSDNPCAALLPVCQEGLLKVSVRYKTSTRSKVPKWDLLLQTKDKEIACTLGMAMRMQKYAVHADYAHMREYADADAGENLIHIIHIQGVFLTALPP